MIVANKADLLGGGVTVTAYEKGVQVSVMVVWILILKSEEAAFSIH